MAARSDFVLYRGGEDDQFSFSTGDSEVPAYDQFWAAGLSLNGMTRVECRGRLGWYDVTAIWFDVSRLLPWKISFSETRPVTGRWVAESAGVRLSAGSKGGIFAAVARRCADYPPNGHGSPRF